MIELNCEINVIVFADNQECKDVMRIGSDNYGIIGSDIIIPLRILNGKRYLFSFRENATVKSLLDSIKQEMEGICSGYEYWYCIRIAVLFGDNEERYYFEDLNQNLSFLLKKYFDYPDNKELHIQLLICGDGAEVYNADGLQYYVYSHERGRHHLPHVHVNTTDHNYSAVITIHDGKIIEGNLPGKKRKQAKKLMLDNQEYFYDCWNKKTDGIRVDINKHFKLISY